MAIRIDVVKERGGARRSWMIYNDTDAGTRAVWDFAREADAVATFDAAKQVVQTADVDASPTKTDIESATGETAARAEAASLRPSDHACGTAHGLEVVSIYRETRTGK